MIFNSVVFGIFFFIVFYLYWLFLKNNITIRNIFLIIVSYIFYGWWDWRFLFLIIISSLVDFIIGKRIYLQRNIPKRKKLLLISLIVNFGFLGFFKYFNFFVDSFIDAFSLFGISLNVSTLNIILPVGISFYTFQSLSYTLDIYYNKFKPTNNVYAFLAFVSFFPQLVAGPIERAKKLLPQFLEKKTFSYDHFRSGLFLMAWGLLKKIVIADRLAKYIDVAYSNVDHISGIPALYAVIFFAFQLYLDFSAYSDIAIGAARTLGFNLSENFRRPYLSSSFSNFWKRWHISLSSWFKDYVYIPLGGSRHGNFRTKRNLIIVFLLSGLWHGASWNFVIWGAINGLFIIIFDRYILQINKTSLGRIFSSIFVSAMWAFSLIFFRAQTFGDAIIMYKNLFSSSINSLYSYGLGKPEFTFTIIILIIMMFIELIAEKKENLYAWINNRHLIVRWTMYIIIVTIILFVGYYGEKMPISNFVYFQF